MATEPRPSIYYFIVSDEALHGITEKQHQALRFWRSISTDRPQTTFEIHVYKRDAEGRFSFEGKWDPEASEGSSASACAAAAIPFEDLVQRSAC